MRMYANHPYLIEITDNVFNIPQRLKAYDSNLFVVRNTKKNTWEIHSHENHGSTYCFTVPYSQLDSRVLEKVRETDVKNRGDKIFKEMDLHNQQKEDADNKERQDWIKDVVKETRWHFKKAMEP